MVCSLSRASGWSKLEAGTRDSTRHGGKGQGQKRGLSVGEELPHWAEEGTQPSSSSPGQSAVASATLGPSP